ETTRRWLYETANRITGAIPGASAPKPEAGSLVQQVLFPSMDAVYGGLERFVRAIREYNDNAIREVRDDIRVRDPLEPYPSIIVDFTTPSGRRASMRLHHSALFERFSLPGAQVLSDELRASADAKLRLEEVVKGELRRERRQRAWGPLVDAMRE